MTLVALAAVLAAGATRAETFRLTPSVTLSEFYSDNIALLPGDIATKGWITGLSPEIRAELSGVRAKGFLDFRLQRNAYSSSSGLDGTRRFLNSSAKVEAVEKLFFVDARANITQQNRSPFGAAATPDSTSRGTNRVETKTYQVSPYLRGDYSDIASYQLRFIETLSQADDPTIPDTRTSEWVAKIGNPKRSAKLGWAIDANALRLRNDNVGTLENSRIRGSLIYAVYPQLHVSAIEGHETTDFAGPPRRGKDTPGVGLEWSPSDRTQLSAVYEKRFFGEGHSALFTHRTPLTAWKLVSIRDVAVLPTQLATSGANSIANLMADLLTSAIPDPEARAAAALRRLEEYGVPGSSPISSDFLTSRPFIVRSTVGSVALLGTRNTVTLTVSTRTQHAFAGSSGNAGSFATDDFRQNGFNANFAHKLTPLTSMTFVAARLRTEGLTATTQTRQGSYSLLLTSRLGTNTTATLGVQHLEFSSSIAIDNYRENAIFGALNVRM